MLVKTGSASSTSTAATDAEIAATRSIKGWLEKVTSEMNHPIRACARENEQSQKNETSVRQ
jgi:hypothetical protein